MLQEFILSIKSFFKNMDMKFDLECKINLKPIYWRTIPAISYGVDDKNFGTILLKEKQTIYFNCPLDKGFHKLWIKFSNKNYEDSKLDQNLDMAVEIESVNFEGMTFDRFKWAGEYHPDYPEDYPDKISVIKSATYLGWNGVWELSFTTPIFTWIHQLENLGWLYEP